MPGGGKLRKTINNGTEYGQVMHLVLDIGPDFRSQTEEINRTSKYKRGNRSDCLRC